MRWYDKYKGLVRRVRLGYRIANLLQYSKLARNKTVYEKFGLKRSVVSPLSHRILQNAKLKPEHEKPEALKQEQFFGISATELKVQFDERGFVVIPAALVDMADDINAEIERLLNEEKVGFNFTGTKIVFANKESDLIKGATLHKELVSLLGFLLDRPVHPFQTINFMYGSEQAAHSDSIHMSTYPEGNLTAAWIALEDVSVEQGALFYYPGSHKLPYIYNEDLGLNENALLLDVNPNKKYEQKVEQLLRENDLEKEVFLAGKGDILIWHPNLLHGGLPHTDRSRTRKSMVVHYFGEGVICYHELTQRPAILA